MDRSKFEKASQTAKHYMGRAVSVGTGLLASGMALAQSNGPDVSSIESEFSTYKVAVVGLVIAFAVVLWAIKGAGLLKPR
ncbi:MAG: hypothetical protein QM612_02245 [Thermomonas sp.]|uniref:hypothetical protein n=1 Tax=Thermomonas sp. TaxID=1971895 RepID=UPI0039E3B3F1